MVGKVLSDIFEYTTSETTTQHIFSGLAWPDLTGSARRRVYGYEIPVDVSFSLILFDTLLGGSRARSHIARRST